MKDKERYEVVGVSSYKTALSLAIQPHNVCQDGIVHPSDFKFKSTSERRYRYQHVVFWPKPFSFDNNNSIIPVHAFDDWPASNWDECDFLKQKMK
jgi:hypothetical protein